jgi:hypothetical protein
MQGKERNLPGAGVSLDASGLMGGQVPPGPPANLPSKKQPDEAGAARQAGNCQCVVWCMRLGRCELAQLEPPQILCAQSTPFLFLPHPNIHMPIALQSQPDSVFVLPVVAPGARRHSKTDSNRHCRLTEHKEGDLGPCLPWLGSSRPSGTWTWTRIQKAPSCMTALGPPLPLWALTPSRSLGSDIPAPWACPGRLALSCHEGLCVWDWEHPRASADGHETINDSISTGVIPSTHAPHRTQHEERERERETEMPLTSMRTHMRTWSARQVFLFSHRRALV